MSYAIRACAWHRERTGKQDNRAVVLTLKVPRDALVPDEAHLQGIQYVVPAGIPPERIVAVKTYDAGRVLQSPAAYAVNVESMRSMIALEELKRDAA